MSESVTFAPLSVADIFGMKDVTVYEYGEDAILTVWHDGVECLLHLFENEIDDRVIYGLNMGQAFQPRQPPAFVGTASMIEVLYAADERNWDFGSLTLKSSDGSMLRIDRNDKSFPEPTLTMRQLRSSLISSDSEAG